MKKIADIALLLCLAAVLFAVPALTLVKTAHNTVSYYENRSLTEQPELTAENFWSGEYFNDWETWYADHVPGRTTLLALGTAIQMDVMGKPVVNDVIVTQDVLLPFLRYGTWDTGIYADKAAPVADRLQCLSDYVEGYGGTFLFVGLPEQSNYFWDKSNTHMSWITAAGTPLRRTPRSMARWRSGTYRIWTWARYMTVRGDPMNITRVWTTTSLITERLPLIRR